MHTLRILVCWLLACSVASPALANEKWPPKELEGAWQVEGRGVSNKIIVFDENHYLEMSKGIANERPPQISVLEYKSKDADKAPRYQFTLQAGGGSVTFDYVISRNRSVNGEVLDIELKVNGPKGAERTIEMRAMRCRIEEPLGIAREFLTEKYVPSSDSKRKTIEAWIKKISGEQ